MKDHVIKVTFLDLVCEDTGKPVSCARKVSGMYTRKRATKHVLLVANSAYKAQFNEEYQGAISVDVGEENED